MRNYESTYNNKLCEGTQTPVFWIHKTTKRGYRQSQVLIEWQSKGRRPRYKNRWMELKRFEVIDCEERMQDNLMEKINCGS